MERRLSPLAFFVALGVAFAAVFSLAVLLPHDPYYRFQAHSSGTTRKADWIYERLHFDPTPVDVALIGTSRTAGGISARIVEDEFCRRTGRRIHVANLGIPETGRNMHYAIAKEAARAKSPALYIVEINEIEARKPHHGFIVLADAGDILAAPLAVNLNYLSDIARLPGRQASLFLETLARRPAVRADFDETAYAGPYLDRTEKIELLDGRAIDKRVARTREELDAAHQTRMAAEAPIHTLPAPLRRLEYRFSRRYLRAIESLAGRKGADVAYAYFPAWRAPAAPDALLEELQIGLLKFDLGGPGAEDPALWFDATHWNARGAEIASLRLGIELALSSAWLGRPGACVAEAD